MEQLAKTAMSMLVSSAMNNGGDAAQTSTPYHSAKSIAQLFKGA